MTVIDALASRVPDHLHPAYRTGSRTLVVTALERLAGDVLHVTLGSPDGRGLAPYQPGSHIVVTAGEKRNAYSLNGADLNPTRYEISVLRTPDGDGSVWLHDNLRVGSTVDIEGPRCLFAAVGDQRHALLVAGGIGVTPILSHARAIVRARGSAEIIYSYRPGHDAHVDDLRALATHPGIELREVCGVSETRDLLMARFRDQPLGTHAYACGPIPMLETYEEVASGAGWLPERVHLERFTAPEQDPGEPFTARIVSTGQTIDVPSGVSLLQRLLESGVSVDNLCRQGVCGECRIPVRSGDLDHRDFVLTDDERAAGDAMMCCVSRGADIHIDL